LRSEQRPRRRRDDVDQYIEKSQPVVRRSEDQIVGVSKPKRSVSVTTQRDDAVAKQCLDVEQDDDSDTYVSSVEEFNDESESDNDDDVLYQLYVPEPVVERAQAKSTCKSKQSSLLQSDKQQLFRQSLQLSQSDRQQLSKQLSQSDRQQMSKLSDSARAPKKSQNKQSRASSLCARQLHERTNVHSSQSVPKHLGHVTVEDSVVHAEASRSEATLIEKEMLMQNMQLKELISQLIEDGRRRAKATPSPSDDTKKTEHYFERSVSADKENEYPSRQLDGKKQLRITNRNVDSERELSRGCLKLTDSDASKENCNPPKTQESPVMGIIDQPLKIDTELRFHHHHRVT